MPKRKDRLRAVFDTNLVIRYFISHRRQRFSNNRQVFELWWLKNQIQLVTSHELVEEYLEIMERLMDADAGYLKLWESRFLTHKSDVVSPGKRFRLSRDPDDNIFLDIAAGGETDYLIFKEPDLLDIRAEERPKYKFENVTPRKFLKRWESLR